MPSKKTKNIVVQYIVMLLKNRKIFLVAGLLVSCSLFLLPLFIFKKQNITRKLQSFTNEEKFFLEAFFRTLISTDNGSYVLFGDKPASLMVYREWQNYDVQPISRFPCGSDFSPERKGFEIWQKYQHLFPSKTYVFVKVGSCFSKRMTAVFFIHKERLLNILSKNFIDFQRVFPQFKSLRYLLNAILNDPSILRQICYKHDLLLGIILGFGKENSALFERKAEIEAFLFPQKFYSYESSSSRFKTPFLRLIPHSGFLTLKEELDAIEIKSDGVIEGVDGLGIGWNLHYPLGFLVDTEKTDLPQLRARLKQDLIKATAAYHKGNFLHVTLNQISN
jgi:hypothetical protein